MADVKISGEQTRENKSQDGCTGLDDTREELKCVFSTETTLKIGTGTTSRRQKTRLLWYVKQQASNSYSVRKINAHFVPVGDAAYVDLDTLISEYKPEVEIHNTRVQPAMSELENTLEQAESHRESGEPLSAEMEFNKALGVDEKNVRAIFGLGLIYLERQDAQSSRELFEELVEMKGAFALEHKHLFNEFGIALRKSGLYDESIKFYSKALALTSEDENLYYNLARVFYEKADWEHCFEFVNKTLELAPSHEQGLALCHFIVALSRSEALLEKHGMPPVPPDVAEMAMKIQSFERFETESFVEIGADGVSRE